MSWYLPTTSSLTSFQMRSISGLCSCMMVMASLLCIPWWSMNSPAQGWLSLWSTTQGTYLQTMEQRFRYYCKSIYVKRGRSGGTESITVELWGLNWESMSFDAVCWDVCFFTYSPLGASSQISNQTSRSNLECMWLQLQREDISDLIISYCTNRRKFISKCKCMYTSQFFLKS